MCYAHSSTVCSHVWMDFKSWCDLYDCSNISALSLFIIQCRAVIFFVCVPRHMIPFKSNYADSICIEYSIFRYLLLKYQIIIGIVVLHAFACACTALVEYFTNSAQQQQQQQKTTMTNIGHYTINKLTTHCVSEYSVPVIGLLFLLFSFFETPFSIHLCPLISNCFLFVSIFSCTHTHKLGRWRQRWYNRLGSPQQICLAFCDISIFYAANG